MARIPLTQGKFAIVDDEDFEYLSRWNWRFYPRGCGYAIAHDWHDGKDKSLKMHRLLLNAPSNREVDHINGDGLDNRKSNLRLVTRQQNCMNQSIRSDNKSGHKGVHWYKAYQQWQVYISFKGKRINLGYFKELEDAVNAYRVASEKYHGEFARVQ